MAKTSIPPKTEKKVEAEKADETKTVDPVEALTEKVQELELRLERMEVRIIGRNRPLDNTPREPTVTELANGRTRIDR